MHEYVSLNKMPLHFFLSQLLITFHILRQLFLRFFEGVSFAVGDTIKQKTAGLRDIVKAALRHFHRRHTAVSSVKSERPLVP